ncbi:MAG: hydroxyphenylacetyl-CoA thioesterase PaaI [Firmicutes bacterium]|nr:hydroxyphenylacetyl-CoA thioesterase PaaI [Bacillota bacterium]
MDQEKLREYFTGDTLARLLGIEILEIAPGYARTSIRVKEDMLNAVGMTHGGTVFSLADLAFAASCNSHGIKAVALSMNINYLRPTFPGETLYATSVEDCVTSRTGVYRITVVDESGQKVAVATGTAFRTGQAIEEGQP